VITKDLDVLKSSLEEELKKLNIEKMPIIRMGATVRLNQRITNAGINTVLIGMEFPEFYTQITIDEMERSGNACNAKIVSWPMEFSTKQETLDLSEIVGFKLTFSSPIYCLKDIRLQSLTHSVSISLIADTIQRQIEMLQAVEQLQHIIKSIIPTKGK